MLRFAASFFTSNTKPTNTTVTSNYHDENSQETTVCVNSTTVAENSNDISNEPTFEEEERFDNENIVLIQSLRKQKQQELAQKVLLRKISHQAVMNHYAQDHLPLSQLQEKLEEDNLPLIVLQEKLKQRDNISIYTTIKENINFLLYSKSSKLNRPKESGETVTAKANDDTTSSSNAPIRDYRDYDVWDDAIIGRLMNLIDTIGMETEEITPKVENELVKEITKEIMKEVVKEESVNESSIFSEESVENTAEENKETIVAVAADDDDDDNNNDDSDDDDDNNDDGDGDGDDGDDDGNDGDDDAVENIQETKNESIKIAEEIINFGETINVAESLLLSKRSNNLTRPRSEILTSSKNKRRSILSFPSSSNNRNSISIPKSLKRNVSNLNRRNSIHSKKSYENDISRSSSISSNFSVNNNTTGVIIEELNEDDYDNTKFRNKFFTTKRAVSTQRSNKSLQFLRNLWKHNQNLSDSDEFLSNKEIKERQYNVKSDHELNRANFQQGRVGESIETVGVRSDPDYSNFYLSMPNGKWMVRTRTGSKKITGTQYVNKELI